MANFFLVLMLVSAAWYLAFVLTKMGGPFAMFDKAREWRQGYWHGRTHSITFGSSQPDKPVITANRDGLLDCIICLMPYVSAGLIVLHHFNLDWVYWPFSIAGLALWAHGITDWIGRG